MAHRELRVAAELVAQEDPAAVALEAPRVVLERAQIDAVELVRPVVAEERDTELGAPYSSRKKKRKACLGLSVLRLNPPRMRMPR